MNSKHASLIGLLFALVFMIIPLISVIKSAGIRLSGTKTSATVSAIGAKLGRKSELRKISVTFLTEDQNLVEATASRWNSVRQGDVITIWYDPSDPRKVYLGDSIGYNMRPVVIGLIILLLCSAFFLKAHKKDMAGKKLMKNGMKVSAELVSIERREEYKMGKDNPYNIKCRWTDSRNSREYLFSSSNYLVDPAPFISGRLNFDVYVNPDDPAIYYMDQSFLPQDKIIPPVLKLWS